MNFEEWWYSQSRFVANKELTEIVWDVAHKAGAEEMREKALIATGWKHAPGLCPDKCSACRFESALPIGAPQEKP